MVGIKPPCGKKCPDRTTTCKFTCDRWKEYETAKRAEYAQREVEFNARLYSDTKERAMRRWIIHKARRPELR